MTTHDSPSRPTDGFALAGGFVLEGVFPPYSLAAEESVIGSLLIDGESIERTKTILTPSDFYTEKNRLCYKAALALYDSGGAINGVTVAYRLQEMGESASIGGPEYLSVLVRAVPTSVYIAHYAKIVVRCARQRALLAVIQKSADWILNPHLEPHEAARELGTLLLRAASPPEHPIPPSQGVL